MRYHRQVKPLLADTQRWSRLSLSITVPRLKVVTPTANLLLMTQNGRVPNIDWIETWDTQVPLPDRIDLEPAYDYLLGTLWDRLDM